MPSLRMDSIKAQDLMTTKLQTMTKGSTISEALGKMREHEVHELPVVDGKDRLVGMVSYETLVRKRNLPVTTKVEHLIQLPPKLSGSDALPDVAEAMLTSGFRALPVVDKGKLAGLIARADLVKAIPRIKELAGVSVGSVMSPSPMCVTENDSILRARALIIGLDEQTVPVVDETNRLTGVVGLKDIAPLLLAPKMKKGVEDFGGAREPVTVSIKGVMRSPAVSVPLGTSLTECIELMLANEISSVIVAENQKPLGVLTHHDLVELLAKFKPRKQVYVQITGLDEDDPSIYESMYAIIQKGLNRIRKFLMPKMLTIHVVRHHAEGQTFKHSVRARLSTDRMMLFGRAYDWDLMKASDMAMRQLEGDARKQKERRVSSRRVAASRKSRAAR